MHLWNVATGKVIRTLAGHEGAVGDATFSPSSKQLAASGGPLDPTIRIWDVATGKLLHTLSTTNGEVVSKIVFSPDGKILASAAYGVPSSWVDLWNAKTGQKLATFEGHADVIHDLAFRNDSRWLASASEDRMIKLWDVRERKLALTLKLDGEPHYVAFSPDGRFLAASEGHKKTGIPVVHVWESKP